MAAQTKKQWMESMAERLKCAVCLEIYKEPVTLPCGHTLCKGCIKEWSSANQQTHWVCPLCKRKDAIVYVERLDVNITMKNLCKEYKDSLDAQSSSKIQPMDHCQYHPNEEARFLCATCKEFFCAICSTIEKKHTFGYHQICTSKDAVEPVTEICNNTLRRICQTLRTIKRNDKLLTDKRSSLLATTAAVKKHGDDLKTKVCQLVDRHISTLLLSIDDYKTTNGASISHLQQLHNELLVLQTSLEQSKITEVNVIARANILFPLLERVNNLNSTVESYNTESVRDPPQFQHCEEINKTLKRQIKECCGLVQQEKTKRNPRLSLRLGLRYPACTNESHRYCEEGKASNSGGIHQQPNLATEGLAEYRDHKLRNKRCKMDNEVPQKINARHMCNITFPSDHCKVDHIGWVDSQMFITDSQESCIWSMNYNLRRAKELYKYDKTCKQFPVSAFKGGDKIMLAVKDEYKDGKHVIFYEIDSEGSRRILRMIPHAGHYSVSLTDDYVCYGNRTGNINVEPLHEAQAWYMTGAVTEQSGYQEVYLGKQGFDTTLYAVKQRALLHRWKVEELDDDIILKDFRSRNFDTYLNSIGKIRSDKNGCVWLLDTNEKMLVCIDEYFYDVKCTINVTCFNRIYDICISDRDIFLLVETDSGICVTQFPLPSKDGLYKLQGFTKAS